MQGGVFMKGSLRKTGMCLSAIIAVAALAPAQAADPYTYNIISVANTAPANFPVITFSVTDNSNGQPANLQTDPAWTQTANGNSRLCLQIAWNTEEINNHNSRIGRAHV